MATTTSPTETATAIATVTVTATAIPYQPSEPTSRGGHALSYGFIVLIILLGLLLILSLGCVGHGFLSRRRARRRGEDPGPVFGYWWWSSRPPMGQVQTQTQAHELQPGTGPRIQADARGREFYNVMGGMAGVRTEQDLKGDGEVGMARYA